MKSLAIITTHPIQYNAPLFQLLAKRNEISIKVFYTWGQEVLERKFDPGFGKNIIWDLPLLSGYEYLFLENTAKKAGSDHFFGIINPLLIDELKKYNPDAILVYGWNFDSHLKVLRYFSKTKTILFRGDSHLLDSAEKVSLKKVLRKVFLKWVYSHINIALYVGSENKRYFENFGLKESQLIFAPHSVDNDRFSSGADMNLRKQFNISDSEIVFLFAGKFEEKKNPLFLLKAFIKSRLSKAHLVLVGNGPLENQIKTTVDQLDRDLKERIHIVGFQNQGKMPEIYQSCDVFLLPSQGPGETWGLSVNEAMACGKAVLVSSRCGCALDLVKPGLNGYVFESNDMGDLVNKLNLLNMPKEKLHELGTYSREVIKDWSFTKVAKSIEWAVINSSGNKAFNL